jgi:2-polyprenyl-3-methyl-5-hydroxy-6-metoxy-1,4-benzoquinol methylase
VSSQSCAPYEWTSTDSGNGRTSENLASVFISQITQLKNIRTICDLGCGNGYITGRLANLGYDVTGIDASSTGIELARRSYPKAKFLEGLIDPNLGSRTGLNEFDLVISSDVIEHLYRPADLIEAAISVLRDNGQILIGTPYHGYLKNLAMSIAGKMDSHFCVLHDGGHIKFFSVRTLSQLIESYGFTDLSYRYYGRAPRLWKNMICHARKS